MGINSHYEISQNNLAPCGIICIFTQDRGNDSVCGYSLSLSFFLSIQKKKLSFVAFRVTVCGATIIINLLRAYGLRAWGSVNKTLQLGPAI